MESSKASMYLLLRMDMENNTHFYDVDINIDDKS